MRALFQLLGIVAFAIGLLWIGQGTGTIDWPRSSFMIRQIVWTYWGAALAMAGGIAIWLARRR